MALSLSRYTWRPFDSALDDILKERSQKEREMSTAMTTMTGDPFPEDVWIEILSRLPVKNLVQFKCVCKSWYAIIRSRDFISKHLKNYYHKSDSDCLIAQYCVTQAGELQSFELLVDEETPNTTVVSSYESLDNLPIHSSYICGPCDGIFYMYAHFYDFLALWNPAINELKTLPPIPNPPKDFSYSPWYDTYSFGLHPVTKDYTVVVMKEYWNEKEDEEEEDMEKEEVRYPLRVFIYSYITDSWRQWGDLSRYYRLENNKCYICLNGAFCWLGSHEMCSRDTKVMIYFDMATEYCQEIQLPDYDKSYNCESLAMYNDSIALLVVQENFLHVWMLNEKYCWVKKFASGPFPEVRYPIGHWKNNMLLLVSGFDHELISYDPDTQEISGLGFSEAERCVGVFVYKESLVLVNNGNGCEKYDYRKLAVKKYGHSSSNQNASSNGHPSSNQNCSSNEEYFFTDSDYEGLSNLFD